MGLNLLILKQYFNNYIIILFGYSFNMASFNPILFSTLHHNNDGDTSDEQEINNTIVDEVATDEMNGPLDDGRDEPNGDDRVVTNGDGNVAEVTKENTSELATKDGEDVVVSTRVHEKDVATISDEVNNIDGDVLTSGNGGDETADKAADKSKKKG